MDREWKANTGRLSLLKRKAATLKTAWQVNRSYKNLKKDLDKHPDLSDEERNEQWNDLHRRNAKLACRHIQQYRGFLTKVGQAASAKAGDLPAPWVEELTPLQDQLPVSPFREVVRTVKTDLGKSVTEVFAWFDEKPFASASVAQVHIAVLRSSGEKVCVKVQHRGVEKIMGTDFATMEYICRKAARYHPETPDLTNLVREWRRASREEVDFHLEAQYAIRAQAALRRAGMDVGCPTPVMEACGRSVLTMEFIEGWKATEVVRHAPGVDRVDIATRIVEGFAMLTFQEGLIHGDPHPGNVFVEPLGEDRARPVLLDWGLVQQVTPAQRVAMARWAVATLSQDRVLYLAALRDLGFTFTDDFEEVDLDDWMDAATWNLRDSINTDTQMRFNEQMHRQREEAAAQAQKNKVKKTVESVPGTVLFFLRGLQMLQSICGTLQVSVPFAQVMLKYALPLLEAPGTPQPSRLLPAPGASALELLVREKLEEFRAAGQLLGGQVAVWRTDSDSSGGAWECSLAFGRAGIAAAPVTESTLMPVGDASTGVLILCLLRALAARRLAMDTPVAHLWPKFVQGKKSGITVRDLLRHEAGLMRPFSGNLTLRGYCSEQMMEEAMAASPRDAQAENKTFCRALGVAVGALLTRVMQSQSVIDAVGASLMPLDLERDIVYFAEEERMGCLGRKPMGQLSMNRIMAWFDERQQRMNQAKRKARQWHAWSEFALAQPGCADPVLVNRGELRTGKGCLVGRGLRATAKALCRLYAADGLPSAFLEQDPSQIRRLEASTPGEWEELGRCLDVGIAGQCFRFQTKEQQEVLGHGYCDGATGSIVIRLPGFSIAILLNAVDETTRHAGREVLSTIAGHLGLRPTFHLEGAPKASESLGDLTDGEQSEAEQEECSKKMDSICGRWCSAESIGLSELLHKMSVPVEAHQLIEQMNRTLRISIRGERVHLATSTVIANRVVEQTTTKFAIGEAFEGQQHLGGTYRGRGTWVNDQSKESSQTFRLEKIFQIDGQEVMMVELFSLHGASRRLALTSILHSMGDRSVVVRTAAEREQLCNCLDPKNLSVREKLSLAGQYIAEGEQLVGPSSVLSIQALREMAVPGTVLVRCNNVRCTTMFERSESKADRGSKGSTSGTPDPASGITCSAAVDTAAALAVPVCMAGLRIASDVFLGLLLLVGQCLSKACELARQSQEPEGLEVQDSKKKEKPQK